MFLIPLLLDNYVLEDQPLINVELQYAFFPFRIFVIVNLSIQVVTFYLFLSKKLYKIIKYTISKKEANIIKNHE
jgi:hypothetical protein